MRHTCRVSVDGPTGFAKFEARYKPAKQFMELFVSTCVVLELHGFNPQNLANTINGEAAVTSLVLSSGLCADDSCAGFAKLGHQPGAEFIELLVSTCVAMELRGFKPQHLANTINGEAGWMSISISELCELMVVVQALQSSAISREQTSWSCL
jgi:hypothetical protein